MRSFLGWIDRKYALPDISEFDPAEADFFLAPKDHLWGVVLGDEAVVLNYLYHCSFRMKLQNLEFLQNFALLCAKDRLDKGYVRHYLSENGDNPYGLQNIMNCAKKGTGVRELTQFPPLYLKKTRQHQRDGIDRFRAKAKVGDLVFMAPRGSGISALIREFDRCQFSHAGIVHVAGKLLEVTLEGKVISDFGYLYDPDFDVALYRMKQELGLTPEQEAAIQRIAREHFKYNWLSIARIYLVKKLHLATADWSTPGDILYSNEFALIDYV